MRLCNAVLTGRVGLHWRETWVVIVWLELGKVNSFSEEAIENREVNQALKLLMRIQGLSTGERSNQ